MGVRAVCVVVVALSGWLAACGYESPYRTRQRHQEGEVKRLSATEIQAEDKRWRALRPLRLDVYATRAYHRGASDWGAQLNQRIADANDALRDFGVQLELGQTLEWTAKGSHDDLDAALHELTELAADGDAEFVLGLVGPMPYALEVYAQIGRAEMLGRHMVMRQMDSVEEMKAFRAGLDTIDEEEILRLYRGRKRHKEASVFLHELGHTLGALHEADRSSFMTPAYDAKGERFSNANREIIARALVERTKPQEQRQPVALVASLVEYLQALPANTFRAEDLSAQLEHLRERSQAYAAATSTPPGARAPAGPSAHSGTDPGVASADDPRLDVASLAASDQQRFAAARAAANENRLREAWKPVQELVRLYPQNYAVNHLACEIAMQGGLPMRDVQKYCDPLTTLAGAKD
jgi:predicted Zn-dependent protease